jgi:hypothetical protein
LAITFNGSSYNPSGDTICINLCAAPPLAPFVLEGGASSSSDIFGATQHLGGVDISGEGVKLIVATASNPDNQFYPLTDSEGNVYTPVFGSPGTNQVYVCLNPTIASINTSFDYGGYGSIQIYWFSCGGTPSLDGHIQANVSAATSFQSGSIATSGSQKLFISTVGFDRDGPTDTDWHATGDLSYLSSSVIGELAGQSIFCGFCYRLANTTQNPTWDISDSAGHTSTGTASLVMFSQH